jgi:hypothetical protein
VRVLLQKAKEKCSKVGKESWVKRFPCNQKVRACIYGIYANGIIMKRNKF